MFGFIPMFYEPSYASVASWQHIGFNSGPFHTFDYSHDLFGDGTVRLLPTPGHTPGHMCELVEMGDYQLLVTGDGLYTLRHLATKQVQAFRLSERTRRQQIDSINRIAGLQTALPQLQLLVQRESGGMYGSASPSAFKSLYDGQTCPGARVAPNGFDANACDRPASGNRINLFGVWGNGPRPGERYGAR